MMIDLSELRKDIKSFYIATSKFNKKQIAKLYKVIENAERELLKCPKEFIRTINVFLNDDETSIQFLACNWCFDVNYKTNNAIQKIQKIIELSANDIIFSLNCEMTLKVFLGNYGGWKRNERYPDLSEYEGKEIDE